MPESLDAGKVLGLRRHCLLLTTGVERRRGRPFCRIGTGMGALGPGYGWRSGTARSD